MLAKRSNRIEDFDLIIKFNIFRSYSEKSPMTVPHFILHPIYKNDNKIKTTVIFQQTYI